MYLENREIRRAVGYGPESTFFYEFYSIGDNTLLLAKLRGLGRREVYRVLSVVDLENKADSKPSSLDVFEDRKLSLAIPLLGNPKLIVLDEPFKGLSGREVREVRDLIRVINKWQGKTVIYTASRLEEALNFASNHKVLEAKRKPLRERFPGLTLRLLLSHTERS